MHALVSTVDKIYPLNIFHDEIDNMAPPITTKLKSKDIKFVHVKGHQKQTDYFTKYNNLADSLAVKASQQCLH